MYVCLSLSLALCFIFIFIFYVFSLLSSFFVSTFSCFACLFFSRVFLNLFFGFLVVSKSETLQIACSRNA